MANEQTERPITKNDILRKLASRKFWVSTAAALGSISAGIAALGHPNDVVAGVGIGCGIASGAILAAVYVKTEGSNDKAAIEADTKQTIVNATASTTDKATAIKLAAPAAAQADEAAQKKEA